MLREHRLRQKQERLRAGNQWRENGLVFTTEFGTPVDPRNLLRVIEATANTAGVKGVVVHTLRHSAATAWLDGGVHIKAVADLLGHSSISITGFEGQYHMAASGGMVTHNPLPSQGRCARSSCRRGACRRQEHRGER